MQMHVDALAELALLLGQDEQALEVPTLYDPDRHPTNAGRAGRVGGVGWGAVRDNGRGRRKVVPVSAKLFERVHSHCSRRTSAGRSSAAEETTRARCVCRVRPHVSTPVQNSYYDWVHVTGSTYQCRPGWRRCRPWSSQVSTRTSWRRWSWCCQWGTRCKSRQRRRCTGWPCMLCALAYSRHGSFLR